MPFDCHPAPCFPDGAFARAPNQGRAKVLPITRLLLSFTGCPDFLYRVHYFLPTDRIAQ